MKTIRIKIYKFDELSEESQKKAIESLSDINVDYEWWQFVYIDAETIGLKITAFDIGRGNYCKGDLLHSLSEVCNLIIASHGEQGETYKTAQEFLAKWNKLVEEHSDGIDKDRVAEDKEYEFDQLADDLEIEFKKSLCEDYRIILQKEYEYMTSEAAIKETIIANEYDFRVDGKMYR